MRKNLLADLVGKSPELTPVNSDPSPAKPAPLGSKGAVGAMSRALAQFSTERDAAAKVMTGQEVVEIDPAFIDRSIVKDRMPGSAADHALLVASIREHGQQVPVLLRPHPDHPERFQIAYGHRRVEALRSLARPVRAVVRALNDAELVVAQGQENSARKDLSFIERATFGRQLEDLGFARETIMAALSVDKTELSRLIAVARAVPATSLKLSDQRRERAAIGGWIWRGSSKEGQRSKAAEKAIAADDFSELDSDARFARVLAATAPRSSPAAKAQTWKSSSGSATAKISQDRSVVTVAIDRDPEFGKFVADNLDEFYRQFQARRGGVSGPKGE